MTAAIVPRRAKFRLAAGLIDELKSPPDRFGSIRPSKIRQRASVGDIAIPQRSLAEPQACVVARSSAASSVSQLRKKILWRIEHAADQRWISPDVYAIPQAAPAKGERECTLCSPHRPIQCRQMRIGLGKDLRARALLQLMDGLGGGRELPLHQPRRSSPVQTAATRPRERDDAAALFSNDFMLG